MISTGARIFVMAIYERLEFSINLRKGLGDTEDEINQDIVDAMKHIIKEIENE